jgi:4'-phosphopantetheinyl transferase
VSLARHCAQCPEDLHVASIDAISVKRWSLYALQPAPGFVGALAIEGSGWRLSQWRWNDLAQPC